MKKTLTTYTAIPPHPSHIIGLNGIFQRLASFPLQRNLMSNAMMVVYIDGVR
jgi:hypothetical protein